MTALVHAYQQMASRVSLRDTLIFRRVQFARINQKSAVTFCLLGVMALGALQYLGALYGVFSFGLQLRDENRMIAQLTEETDKLELNVQRASANFPADHKELLSSMEKISEVRYITGENAAMSYLSLHP